MSIPLIVVAATGGAIVFEGAIDRALNPHLNYVQTTGANISLDTLVARAQHALRNETVFAVSPAQVEGRAATASGSKGTAVFLDPHTGDVLGTRTPAERELSLARRLHVLHVRLVGEPVGGTIVGISTIIAFVMVLTGLVLWWRDKQWQIRASASWKRIVFDLHHASGILTSVVLLIITASGLVIHYDGLGRAIESLNQSPVAPPPKQPPADSGAATISFDRAAQAATTALPGASIMSISIPPGGAPVGAAMRFPEDHTPGGRSRVAIDRYRGTVLAAVSTRTAQPGTRINNLKRSLHTGDVFGRGSEAIWLVAVVAMVAQIVTGLLMWWNGRPARRAAAGRAAS